MKRENYKILFIIVGLVGSLLFAAPTLALIVHLPSEEKFSEIWVLGSSNTTEDYPFNVTADETYKIFVGVANHMASSSYYIVNVKFGNQSDPSPDQTTGTPSPLPILYKYHSIVPDGGTWETQLAFSFSNISVVENQCVVGNLKINGGTSTVDKRALWNFNYTGYYYQLIFELWVYNPETEVFQFHNRYVRLWLNMTLSYVS